MRRPGEEWTTRKEWGKACRDLCKLLCECQLDWELWNQLDSLFRYFYLKTCSEQVPPVGLLRKVTGDEAAARVLGFLVRLRVQCGDHAL